MRSNHQALAARVLLACASIGIHGTWATAQAVRADGRVTLVKRFEVVPVSGLSSMLALKTANLGRIDPDHPLADDTASQTLSMFGREDLIAATSEYYRSNHCALRTRASVLDEVESQARKTSIVIINESHERSEDRGFAAMVARKLRPLGYDTLAIETLVNDPPSTPERYRPAFERQPKLPYFVDEDGVYLSEAGFGRFGRQAKALGYRLVPYEFIQEAGPAPGTTEDQQIALREEGQARALAAYLGSHPGTRMLVYVGYHHAAEVPLEHTRKWLALRLKQKTGIDPLTISQTTCRGGGDTDRLAVLPVSEPKGTFDLIVDHPTARFVRGRPAWRMSAGDRPVSIPRALYPTAGWRVVEARPVGEPAASVPMDRVAIRPGEDIALMLPPGRYRLRGIDVAYVPKQ